MTADPRVSRLRSPWLFCAAITVALQAVGWKPLAHLDLQLFDVLVPDVRPRALDSTLVVAIDDDSIAALGPWPWSRHLHAALIDRAREAGASVVAYDVLLTEPSATDGSADRELAEAIRRNGRVVLPVAPIATTRDGVDAIAALKPLSIFEESARALGHVDVEIDSDAIVRRVYLEAGAGATNWPALPIAARRVEVATGPSLTGRRAPPLRPDGSSSWIRDYEALLPHLAAPVPQVSLVAVLRDPAVAARLSGKALFVGVTAAGLGAELTTTLANDHVPMPAVEFNAWTYAAARDGLLITPLGSLSDLLLGLPIFAALLWWAPHVRRSRSLVVTLSIGFPVAIAAALLATMHVWFAPVSATIGLLIGNLWWHGRRLREAGRQLLRTRAQAEATLQAIADAVIRVDAQQRISYANPVAHELSGRSTLIGLPVVELFVEEPPHRNLVGAALAECAARVGAVRVQTDLAWSTREGPNRLVRMTATPLFDADHVFEGAVLAISDVTESAEAAARLDHAATHDALTGLPNRVFLRQRLQHTIADVQRSGRLAAVLFVDLDRFKRINDSLGHRTGDQVLEIIANRLRSVGRSNDTVARWGGDEFVVLLDDLATRDVIAHTTMRLMEAISQVIPVDGMDLQCSCSVGIAVVPHDATDIDSLLAMADMAMYRARAKSAGRFDFYSPEMALWTRDRLTLENGLRQALVRTEFELHYQPQVDLESGRLVALEALLRWRTPSGELLLPDRFVEVAEESGLILGIGEWVIDEVAGQLAHWQAGGLKVLPVAVNVSARQCLDHRIVRIVRAALERTGIPPQWLMLEITETAAMRDVEHVIDLLRQISALGVGIAVDDFGTGYSSLSYLKRFPISQIKIDRSFVRDIGIDHNDASIVRSIIALAHSLGLPVVAEGVETEIQRVFLDAQGCDFAQGYLFSEPLPVDALVDLLRSQSVPAPAAPPPRTEDRRTSNDALPAA